MGNPRIEELRRRIQKDPASIAFAQLAEEHRRAGQFEDAVRVCRDGLAQHPAYLSARITLGRALLEMGRYDEAVDEFDYVLKAAPDNLSAIRELADIEQRGRARAPQVETKRAVAPELPPTLVDPVIAELEAWLAVLADDRDTRVTRI
ncbi:MAG TPA: tetratricopeptide repeat protein [Vicinamibacterales bacterium]|nr:tetratricopeptide repeat protein [Vicinamibacterales bacterium]